MSNAEVFAPQGELNGVNGYVDQPPTAQSTDYSTSTPMNGLPVGQPGSSKSTAPPPTANGAKLVMDYRWVRSKMGLLTFLFSTDFPKLPEAKAPTVPTSGAWARRPLTLAVVTETFKLSADEVDKKRED